MKRKTTIRLFFQFVDFMAHLQQLLRKYSDIHGDVAFSSSLKRIRSRSSKPMTQVTPTNYGSDLHNFSKNFYQFGGLAPALPKVDELYNLN